MLLINGLFLEGCLAVSAQSGHGFGMLEQPAALHQQAEKHRTIQLSEAGLDDEPSERNLAIGIGFSGCIDHAKSL